MNAQERLEVIYTRLNSAFSPQSLQVIDEGAKHIGHVGAGDGRGHFVVMIVSDAFRELSLLARHRAIYDALGDLMQTDIHALSIHAEAPLIKASQSGPHYDLSNGSAN